MNVMTLTKKVFTVYTRFISMKIEYKESEIEINSQQICGLWFFAFIYMKIFERTDVSALT